MTTDEALEIATCPGCSIGAKCEYQPCDQDAAREYVESVMRALLEEHAAGEGIERVYGEWLQEGNEGSDYRAAHAAVEALLGGAE